MAGPTIVSPVAHPDGSESLGIPALDMTVLSFLYDGGLLPTANHRQTAKVVRGLCDDRLCAAEDAYQVLQRLSADWLMPLPLVDSHGNLGSMYEPPAEPYFNEVRLTLAGAMTVEASRGRGPVLPIGLINGDLPSLLGASFGLWPTDSVSSVKTVRVRPGFDPAGLVAALNAVATPGRVSSEELAAMVGPPWLGPFEPPAGPFDELVGTGRQTVRLAPVKARFDDWRHPAADVQLDLGAPLLDLLWEWVAQAGDRSPDEVSLSRLVASRTA